MHQQAFYNIAEELRFNTQRLKNNFFASVCEEVKHVVIKKLRAFSKQSCVGEFELQIEELFCNNYYTNNEAGRNLTDWVG